VTSRHEERAGAEEGGSSPASFRFDESDEFLSSSVDLVADDRIAEKEVDADLMEPSAVRLYGEKR
jgi:hypothetical protein